MRPDALQILLDRMLSEDDLAALLEARHPDPFSVLGKHADADGDRWVRAPLPGARSVALLDTATARRVGRLLAAIASDRRSVIRSPLRRAAEGSAGSSAQCFGRIQVDDELILARLLDRVEVLRLLAQAMPN